MAYDDRERKRAWWPEEVPSDYVRYGSRNSPYRPAPRRSSTEVDRLISDMYAILRRLKQIMN